ncbi:membrane-associated protein, putative [Bodo saltans]|uniref:Membrane-associated protein, putative n=1 Tax=Bodo saltans TaxID=75058 RepID=A0A0S4KIW2_BODSA|nr:membrane-associated protein, putative [Bodo saltans]|eukprot:CUI15103.1 membrane-associated protein, putative [Bodo saltans]
MYLKELWRPSVYLCLCRFVDAAVAKDFHSPFIATGGKRYICKDNIREANMKVNVVATVVISALLSSAMVVASFASTPFTTTENNHQHRRRLLSIHDGFSSSTTWLTSWVPLDPSTVNITSTPVTIMTTSIGSHQNNNDPSLSTSNSLTSSYTTITYDGEYLWCTSIDGRLVRMDESTLEQIEVFSGTAAAATPSAASAASDGGGGRGEPLRVPRGMNVIALGTDALWFTNGGSISWVSTTNGTLTTLSSELPACAATGIFHGSAYDGRKYIWTIGYDPCLVRIDVHTGEMIGIPVTSSSRSSRRGRPRGGAAVYAYSGVVFDGRYVWLVPHDDISSAVVVSSDNGGGGGGERNPLVRVDPITSEILEIPFPAFIRRRYLSSGRPFRRAIFKAPDSLYLLPFSALAIVKVNTTTLHMTAIAHFPRDVVVGTAHDDDISSRKLHVNGAAFDGRHIWMGTITNFIICLDTTTDTMRAFRSRSSAALGTQQQQQQQEQQDASAISSCTFTGSAVFCVTARGRVMKIAPPETSPLLLKSRRHYSMEDEEVDYAPPRRAESQGKVSRETRSTKSLLRVRDNNVNTKKK